MSTAEWLNVLTQLPSGRGNASLPSSIGLFQSRVMPSAAALRIMILSSMNSPLPLTSAQSDSKRMFSVSPTTRVGSTPNTMLIAAEAKLTAMKVPTMKTASNRAQSEVTTVQSVRLNNLLFFTVRFTVALIRLPPSKH